MSVIDVAWRLQVAWKAAKRTTSAYLDRSVTGRCVDDYDWSSFH
jgi:hypothetical protein